MQRDHLEALMSQLRMHYGGRYGSVELPAPQYDPDYDDTTPQDDLCTVCLTRTRTFAFIPCGHLAICSRCLDICLMQQRNAKLLRCVLCSEPTTGTLRVYHP